MRLSAPGLWWRSPGPTSGLSSFSSSASSTAPKKWSSERTDRKSRCANYSNTLGLSLLKMHRDAAAEANREMAPEQVEELREPADGGLLCPSRASASTSTRAAPGLRSAVVLGARRVVGLLGARGEQVVGPRGSAISSPAGGAVVDVEARAGVDANPQHITRARSNRAVKNPIVFRLLRAPDKNYCDFLATGRALARSRGLS